MSIRVQLLVAIVLLFQSTTSAQGRRDVEAALNRDFKGQVITQKRFECGAKVKYSADGSVSAPSVGSWTTCGKVRVLSVALPDDHTIRMQGERVSLGYDGKRRDFGVIKTDKKQSRVEIEIASPSPLDETGTRAALAKIFLQGNEYFSDFVPDCWKPFLVQREIGAGQRPKSDAIPTPKVEKVGEYILPPRAKHFPDPDYDPAARKAKYQGTTVLWMIVDEHGDPRDVRITKPLGLGLDEKAVDAVRRWKFEPAKGKVSEKPVAVQISVEVNFRLYNSVLP